MNANVAVLVRGVEDVFFLDVDLATMTNDKLIDKTISLASKSMRHGLLSFYLRYKWMWFVVGKRGQEIRSVDTLFNLGFRDGDIIYVSYEQEGHCVSALSPSSNNPSSSPEDSYTSEFEQLIKRLLFKLKKDCIELDNRALQMQKRLVMLEDEYEKDKMQLEELNYRNMENERELMRFRENKTFSYEPARIVKEDATSSLSVNASLYAPSQIKKGSWEKIQVFLYKDDEFDEVERKASSVDPNAKIMSYNPLDMFLNIGDTVDVAIRMYDHEVRMPQMTSRIIWRGYYKSCEFLFQLPKDSNVESIAGEAEISVNNIQIGKLVFNSDVIEGTPAMLYAKTIAKAYKKVFISYSHKDKKKAEVFAKLCRAQGQEFFFDRQTLMPGDNFDSEIEKFIRSADLFILCWSRHASRSKYVKREYTYALGFSELKKRPEEASLKISPFSISPRKKPPVELAMMHFEEI